MQSRLNTFCTVYDSNLEGDRICAYVYDKEDLESIILAFPELEDWEMDESDEKCNQVRCLHGDTRIHFSLFATTLEESMECERIKKINDIWVCVDNIALKKVLKHSGPILARASRSHGSVWVPLDIQKVEVFSVKKEYQELSITGIKPISQGQFRHADFVLSNDETCHILSLEITVTKIETIDYMDHVHIDEFDRPIVSHVKIGIGKNKVLMECGTVMTILDVNDKYVPFATKM
jgi:hypothetical protein